MRELMTTIPVQLDPQTESDLQAMSNRDGTQMELVAARLLARAVRAARPKRSFDTEKLRAQYAEFESEEQALAESAVSERAALLSADDQA
jgi:hypothetical protein